MRALRPPAWTLLLAFAAVPILAYPLVSSSLSRALLFVLVQAGGAAAVVLGMRARGTRNDLVWVAFGASQLLWLVGQVLWWIPIVRTGAPPPSVSAANAFFLAGNVLIVIALAAAARRRDRGPGAMLDAAVASVAVFVLAWVLLIHRFVLESGLPVGTIVVQTTFLTLDVLFVSFLVRALVTPGPRSAPLWLLLGGITALVSSDALWNWGTLGGVYVPGQWADAGWLCFPILVGAAALHPSARTAFAARERAEGAIPWGYLLVQLAVWLAVPAAFVLGALEDGLEVDELLVVSVGAMLMGVLLAVRAALLFHERGVLQRELAAAGDRLLAKTQAELERLGELDRLKAEFVATVSHELRTPLTSILGYLELVLEDASALPDDARRSLAVVHRNADRLQRLVSDLLLVSQIEAGKLDIERSPVELESLACECIQSHEREAAAREIELTLASSQVPAVSGDRVRLAQLLDNLLSNALKFTPPGGHVEVGVHADRDRAVIAVADSGMGIAEDDLERLFERFFRARGATGAAVPGTGLGLTIAKAIAEAHGGSIDVHSVEGQGTTFVVTLPLASEISLGVAA